MSHSETEAHEKATLLRSPERVLATLNADGTRRWIRPRLSLGSLHSRRRAVAYVLMAIFVAVPHIRIGGAPLMLLDLPAREFTLLGTVFKPTDSPLLMLLVLVGLLGIFLITALVGRAWCGWACPQTVYMEFLFRPLERLFEGSPQEQAKLDRQGGGLRRVAKNVVFALIACFLAHTFLAYFVGWGQLLEWIQGSPTQHPVAFLVMAGVTAAMVIDFVWFREQTCLVVCPYGRFQSVLLDRDSLIVGYDPGRGEPRGKPKKKRKKKAKQLPVVEGVPAATAVVEVEGSAPKLGDCIDCGACVITCPTGIDIRDGLQMECIHCTQCADACDAIMTRIGRPTGLIRYCSQNELQGERKRLTRPRVIIYVLLIVLVASLLVVGLSRRGGAYVTILRGLAAPFVELPSGEINNQVRIKVYNRTQASATYHLNVEGLKAEQLIAPENPLVVEAGAQRTTTVFIKIPRAEFLGSGKRPIVVTVDDEGEFHEKLDYILLGPVQ